MTAFQAGGARMSVRRQGVDAAARPLRTEYVTGNYFLTFGVGAFGGRVFNTDDDTPASPPVIVLSHHAWQAVYGGDPSVVGSTFMIEGSPFTAIGIAAAGFYGETLRGNPPDVWIPVHQEPLLTAGNGFMGHANPAWLRAIGRLRPGASIDGVAPRLTSVIRQWMLHDAEYPASSMPAIERALPRQSIAIVPAGAGVGIMKAQYGQSLQMLMWVCALVLLIACANVANLLLARAAARRSQTAVRLAVGASRAHIVWQALIESVLLGVAGGVAGLLVAAGAARLLLSLAFSTVTFLPIDIAPSLPVLGFSFAIALATGIAFGAAPAWFATRTDPIDALRGSSRRSTDRSSLAQRALLVVQATVSVVLVAGAAMLGRSLSMLENQDFGFATKGRILVGLNRPPATYTVPQLRAVYRRLDFLVTDGG